MKDILKIVTIFFLTIFMATFLVAQEDARTLLENLEEEDQKSIDALVMYPEDTRLAIFHASMYPEALIKLQRMQMRTSSEFMALMDGYSETTQKEVWDLTRYPELIHRLLNESNRNTASIDNILSDYPAVIHKRAKDCLKNQYDLLQKIDAMTKINQATVDNLLARYDPKTKKALRQLIELPEVMALLTDNIDVTILVGDAYKTDPLWVVQKADSLNLALARQNVQELEDWKKSVEENPEVAEELKASAEEFALENGYDDLYYDDDEYEYAEDDLYYYEDEREEIIIEKHYYHHYPYWFGYPHWYSYPRWRPFPYWYDWGFNWSPRRHIHIVWMPSFYYMDWYFYHPHHHYHYPHMSAHFANHYYGHRNSVGSITSSVHVWKERNRAVITDDMIANAPKRINNFREFGKMETARQKYNEANPKRQISQVDYLDKKSSTYPNLKKRVTSEDKLTSKGEPKTWDKPTVPKTRVPVEKPRTQPQVKDVPARKPLPPVKKKQEIDKIKKAKDYHRKTWEKSKQQTTRKKVVPPKKTTPKKVVKKPTKKVEKKPTKKIETKRTKKKN